MGTTPNLCQTVAQLLLEGEGVLLRKQSLQAHVRDCSTCLDALWQADPILTLSSLAAESLGDEFWRGGWEDLQGCIERRRRKESVRLFQRAFGTAAVLCIGILLAFFSFSNDERRFEGWADRTTSLVSTAPVKESYPLVEESEMSYTLLRAEDGTQIVYFFLEETTHAK